MAVVIAVLIVISHHSAVVTGMQRVIDVSKVVTRHTPLGIYPNFPPQLAIASLARDVVDIICNFLIRHDVVYQACVWRVPAF